MDGRRWKYEGAKDFAEKNPLSDVYKLLQSLTVPMQALMAHTSVILHVGTLESDLLTRACFGRIMFQSPHVPSTSSSSVEGTPLEMENEMRPTNFFELCLEEAFFLCYELKCLHVYLESKKGRMKIGNDDLWIQMQNQKQGFLENYKAYSHLRSKNWVVRSGLQYGADFVAYCHHPAQVHSEYAVIVLPGSVSDNPLTTWTHLQGVLRLCGSVAKTLLLVHIIKSSMSVDTRTPSCLRALSVKEIEVKRWLPEKNRELKSASCSIP